MFRTQGLATAAAWCVVFVMTFALGAVADEMAESPTGCLNLTIIPSGESLYFSSGATNAIAIILSAAGADNGVTLGVVIVPDMCGVSHTRVATDDPTNDLRIPPEFAPGPLALP